MLANVHISTLLTCAIMYNSKNGARTWKTLSKQQTCLWRAFWCLLVTAGWLARKRAVSYCLAIWLFDSYSKTQQNNNVSRKAWCIPFRDLAQMMSYVCLYIFNRCESFAYGVAFKGKTVEIVTNWFEWKAGASVRRCRYGSSCCALQTLVKTKSRHRRQKMTWPMTRLVEK